MVVPVFATDTPLGYSLVEDQADLLTDEEEAELLDTLETIQADHNMDVAVVTVYSLEGKTATEYADDFFDYNGYGQNESHDGILFLLGMDERKWAITTTGLAIPYFTDAGQAYMTDQFMSEISDGNYFDGFMQFANLCEKFIVQAETDEPYDVGNLPKHLSLMTVSIEIVVCFTFALAYCYYEKSKLKTIRENEAAMEYIKEGSVDITVRQDRFINQIVTSRVIPKNNSSEGGSSTHTSSSGTSHGGSSGSF